MRPVPERTIARAVAARGIGIHTGAAAEVRCLPAPAGSGVVFHRADLDGPPIPARIEHVAEAQRAVTLGAGGARVRTVEHLLAAAAGLGVTNLTVELHGEEVPILDGSAAPYCALLAEAGIVDQDRTIAPLRPPGPVWTARGEASLLAVPAERLRVTYVVPLRHPVLGPALAADVTLDDGAFVREVAPARTWGFTEELEALRARGLAAGATPATALGIGPRGYLTAPRMPDEPARHKILDLVGDLALLGRPLAAHVIAVGGGHALHLELARTLARG